MDSRQFRLYEQLNILIEFTSIINSTLDLNDLMNIVMEKARSEMQAEACSVLLYNQQTNKLEFEIAICDDEKTCEILKNKIEIDMGQGIAGWTALHQESLYIDDVSKDDRFFKGVDKTTGFVTKSIIAVPLIGRRGLIGVVEIINPNRKDYDKNIFHSLCKQFAIAIENAILFNESLQKEKLKQQLEIASQIQKSFMPANAKFIKGDFTVNTANIAAYSVGGDLYDFVDLGDTQGDVFIADISGKGISAALYMAKLISDFRHICLAHKSVEQIIFHLNNVVSNAPMGMFVTAVYLSFDTLNGDVQYINAANPPFIKIDSKGNVIVINHVSGPPLGIMQHDYKTSLINLSHGERIILFTDGVIDTLNASGQRLGLDKVVNFLAHNAKYDDLLTKFVDFIIDYTNGQEMSDDITILEVARR